VIDRRKVLLAGVVALVTTITALVLLTPWQPLGSAGRVTPLLTADFTPAQIVRAQSFRARLGPWPYLAIMVSLAVPWVVLVAAGRVHAGRVARRRRTLLVSTVVALTAAQWLLTLPMSVHSETVLRAVGLSTQQWGGWLRDEATALGISVVLSSIVVLAMASLVRRARRRWPWLLAVGAALLTVAGSVAYPLLIENIYNDFTPLPPSALTQRIEQVAARDGYADVRVVVSDASIRTTRENAHVSGLGATRWVVLDDTLIARALTDPDAVVAVVAHEFGHVVHGDVARGTALGALGAVSAVLLLAGAAGGRRGRAVFAPGSDRARDVVRTVAVVLAVAGGAPYVVAPVTNLVSRRIEASADVHALEVTRDMPAFVRMQHDLATSNLSRLQPTWWQSAYFATHPDPAWRIAQARTWQALRG